MHRTNCFADFENNKTRGVLNQARQSSQWYVTPFGMASNKKSNKISTQGLKFAYRSPVSKYQRSIVSVKHKLRTISSLDVPPLAKLNATNFNCDLDWKRRYTCRIRDKGNCRAPALRRGMC